MTVNGDTLVEPNETFTVNITNVSGASVTDGSGLGTIQNDDTANLVISQVYGGGDNSGAPFRNDFVEIYNHGTTTVDFSITPYSIQYASVGSNFGTNKTNLTTGTLDCARPILPGSGIRRHDEWRRSAHARCNRHHQHGQHIRQSRFGLRHDVSRRATCPGDDGTSPFNPSSAAIADLVGYGNSATTTGHCYEGTGPAPRRPTQLPTSARPAAA